LMIVKYHFTTRYLNKYKVKYKNIYILVYYCYILLFTTYDFFPQENANVLQLCILLEKF